MERYDSYKDSGVKWLGKIPSHWEVKRLRAALTERKERYSNLESLMILSLIKDKGIIPYDEKGEVGNKSKDDHTQYKVARKGDLVINSMNVIIGSLGITPYDGYISPAYYSFKPCDEVNLTYYNYILSLRRVQQSIRCFSKGIMEIRLKISAYDFLSMPFPFPTLKEQETIANYLNTATSKIEEAIAQQQKMIDLLNERKQIIINNAVTKGLDPNVKMKPSGVDWIGDIPEHWNMRRMRYLCSITTGNKDTINRVEDGVYPFYVRSPKVERINTYSYDGEAVLMAGDGVGAGKVFHYVNGKFDYHQRVYNFYNIKLIKGKLLYYYMKNKFKYVIEQLSAKSTVDSVRLNMIQDFVVVIPSNNEQELIIEYLDSQMIKLDKLINTFEKQTSLLQERKQIIINDVVTGKVKVV